MTNFVLMLTRNDVTVPDAHAVLEVALAAGVEHVGFKDIGLPRHEMALLVDTIHEAGLHAHLEVVSLTEEDERTSVQIGRELGFDYVLGGTRWQLGASILSGSGVQYFPYAGTVVGHPGTLDGSDEQILSEIAAMKDAVTGVNLLAYRHVSQDGDALVTSVCQSSPIPVLVAGSVAAVDRIKFVTAAGAWGFTVGAAVLDRKVVPGRNVTAQLQAVLEVADAAAT